MAITRTKKYGGVINAVGGSTAGALTGNTGALAFTAGRLVLVKVAGIAGTDGFNGFTVASTGWSFTSRVKTPDVAASAFLPLVQFFTATVPSTGNHTLTIATAQTTGERVFNIHAEVVEFDGADTATFTNLIAPTSTTSPVDGAYSITLPNAPASTSYVEAMVSLDTDAGGTKNITEGSGWVESSDISSATTFYGSTQSQYRTGSTSTSVAWADLLAGTGYGTYSRGAAALEIVEASAGPVDVAGTPTIVSAVSAVAVVTGHAAITAAATIVQAVSAVAVIGSTLAVQGVPSVVAAVSAVAEVTATTEIAPTGTVVAAVSGTADVVVSSGRFPATVSGNSRYLLDQLGDPWFGVGDTAWSMSAQLTTAEITTYLEDRAAKNVNVVLVNAPEPFFSSQSPKYRNQAGQDPFTGAAFGSSLNNSYWTVVDHAVEEALRLGITLIICPAYLGNGGEGWASELSSRTNTNLTNYGNALAARYSAYPNIIWLCGHDRVPDATLEARMEALFAALAAGTDHLVMVGSLQDAGTPAQGYGSYAWDASDVAYDIDTDYSYAGTPAATTATGWGFSPARPIWAFEYVYEQEQSFEATLGDEPLLRYQMWGPLCAGACGVLFGNNPIWHFECSNDLYDYTGTWESNLDSPGSEKLAVLGGFVALHGAAAITSMVPDTGDTFLTSGEGSGTTRAAARFNGSGMSGLLAVAYRPHGGSSSLTFDMSEFAASNVRISTMDPVSGDLTVVGTYANSGSQSVGSFGTNAAGDGDWVILFEAVEVVAVSGASTVVQPVSATADVTATTDLAGTGTAVTAVSATATVTQTTLVTPAGTIVAAISATAEVTGPAAINGAPAAVLAVSGVADVTATTELTATGTVVAAVSATATILLVVPSARGTALMSVREKGRSALDVVPADGARLSLEVESTEFASIVP